jgi:alkanesulfonate monooxygenase SsuD/methylene tetrahydromethanopterin reductase-like flavin-dependent oxidoreductase (luciferase family)
MSKSDAAEGTPRRAVMVLSENWTLTSPLDLKALVDLALVAEQSGVDTVMLSEHVVLGPDSVAAGGMVNPRDYAAPGNQNPATPWPDSIVLASAIAAVTTTVRIALAAVIAPLRHPLLLAKQLGTLDLLAGGRLVVQPTVSWSRDEYRALGVDFSQRGAMLDAELVAMNAAWTAPIGEPSSHVSAHYNYGDVWCEPRRGVAPAMWFGGERLHDALIERIVRYGSGFHPFGSPTPEELRRLSESMVAAGRDPATLELVGGIRGRFVDATSTADLHEALADVPAKIEAGYRSICFKPSMFTDAIEEVGRVCTRVAEAIKCA